MGSIRGNKNGIILTAAAPRIEPGTGSSSNKKFGQTSEIKSAENGAKKLDRIEATEASQVSIHPKPESASLTLNGKFKSSNFQTQTIPMVISNQADDDFAVDGDSSNNGTQN